MANPTPKAPMTFGKTLLATILGVFVSLLLLSFVFVMIVIAIVSSAGESDRVVIPAESILKIDLEGSLPEYSSGGSIFEIADPDVDLTVRDYLVSIREAADDERIKGCLLRLGKYSGNWAQAEELRTALVEFKKSGKFLYAESDVQGYDEVNYYLATVADSVLLHPAAGIELNGVYAGLSFFKPMLEKLGINPQVVRAGKFKSAVEPFILDSASVENKEMISSIVNSTFEHFKQEVIARRKLSAVELQSIIDSRALLTAGEALNLKLVDALVYDDELTALLMRRMNKDTTTRLNYLKLSEYARELKNDLGNGEGSDNQVAIIYAVGAITSGESGFSPNPLFGGQMLGSETFVEAMRSARENKNIKAIVLRIDSPGGDAAASEAMWREVKLATTRKPVIVSMAGVAASGGYFIAAAADTIVAEPSTITGSIGVFGLIFNMEGFFRDKLGVNNQTIATNPHADMMSGSRDLSELERGMIEKSVDTVYQRFLRIVAEGRGIPVDSVDQIAQGRVWTGEQAQLIGLVDELGGLDRAIEIAVKRSGVPADNYGIRILPKPKSWIERLTEDLGGGVRALLSSSSVADDYRVLLEAVNRRSGIQARMVEFRLR